MELNFDRPPQEKKLNLEFERLENFDRANLRPEINDILGQLIASEREEAYSKALANVDSSDREIKEDAIGYLERHRAYLRDSADVILKMGFETPEEDDVRAELVTRIGVISEKLEGI